MMVGTPLARHLIAEYGDFFIVDCTFKLTSYLGRSTMFISVMDRCGQVHPTHVCDVSSQREQDWLAAFDDGWELVQQLGPADFSPKSAILVYDEESAVISAWGKSQWTKSTGTTRCTVLREWSAMEQVMANGERFGVSRGNAWCKHVYATCSQSFSDGIATVASSWREKGDDIGADHLFKLASTSRTPLHKWAPVPCPFVATGGADTITKLVNKSPTNGKRKMELTFLQQAKRILDIAHRSCRMLREGPELAQTKSQKCMRKHLQQQGKMSQGEYTLLLAGLVQLSHQAVSWMLGVIDNHYLE